jgi:putative serine protease PepD
VAERRLGVAVLAPARLCAAAGRAAWWRTGGETVAGQPVASVAGAVLEREPSAEVEAALQRSVLLVRARACGTSRQGTVSVVSSDGRAVGLTNQHVVAGASEVSVVGADGAVGEVGVEGVADDRDAVELDADALVDHGAAPLEIGPRPVVGARVVVAGYPDGRFEALTGTVRSIEPRHGYGGTTDVLVVDVEAVPGISGGVVVDAVGRAVGLIAARDPVTHEVVAYPLDVLGGVGDRTAVPCP